MSLVMFDYDGVIVDSFDQVAVDFAEACRSNGFDGMNKKEDLVMVHQGNCYAGMMKMGLDEATVDKIISDYEVITRHSNKDPQVFEGMVYALQEISKKHTIVIITSNISDRVKRVLQKNRINSVTDIIGAEIEKSKVIKIKKTIQKYRLFPRYYIGDTAGDILEGREAGALTIGVTWGWHSIEKLEGAEPEYLVHTPEELVRVLCSEHEKK